MRTDRSNPRLGSPQNSQRCLFLPFPFIILKAQRLRIYAFHSSYLWGTIRFIFIRFISLNDPKSLPPVCSRCSQSTYLLRYECLRFWANIIRVKRGNREIASTFVEIICTCRLPSRVPDERTHVLHPIKMLTCWIRGKIIIIVCLFALKISWRFHHLTINPIIEIDDIATFLFYTIAVLTNSQSSDKARSNGSPQFSRA